MKSPEELSPLEQALLNEYYSIRSDIHSNGNDVEKQNRVDILQTELISRNLIKISEPIKPLDLSKFNEEVQNKVKNIWKELNNL